MRNNLLTRGYKCRVWRECGSWHLDLFKDTKYLSYDSLGQSHDKTGCPCDVDRLWSRLRKVSSTPFDLSLIQSTSPQDIKPYNNKVKCVFFSCINMCFSGITHISRTYRISSSILIILLFIIIIVNNKDWWTTLFDVDTKIYEEIKEK